MFRYTIDGDVELMLLEERHAEELYRLIDRNRVYLRQWLPWPDSNTSVEDSVEFIRRCGERLSKSEGVTAGIWYNGRLAGVISFVTLDLMNRSAAIGYWVSEDCQGRGLATRACRAMVDYGFGELGLNRLVIRAATGNLRSQAVPERLGFTSEGVERQAQWLNDHFIDIVIYSLLRSEWLNQSGTARTRVK